jgi:hypothetical protein
MNQKTVRRHIGWLLLFFVAGVLSMRASTITWTNTSGGNWSASSNWSPNSVPGSNDDAFIIANGTYGVTLNISPTVNSLTLGGSSGVQTFHTSEFNLTLNTNSVVNANGAFDMEGGTFYGPGSLTVSGTLNWSGGQMGNSSSACTLTVATNGLLVVNFPGGAQNDCWGVLTNAGTMRLLDGTVRFVGGCSGFNFSALVNLPGALVDYHGDATMFAYCASTPFNNFGTVRKSAGTGTSGLGIAFYNSGILDVQTGTVDLDQGGEGGGLFEAEAGTTLQMGGGTYTVDPGGVLAGAGTHLWNGSSLFLNGNATGSNLVLAGGYLLGGGVISGSMTWTNGQIGQNGDLTELTVATNGLLVVNFSGGAQNDCWGTLTNAGTVRLLDGTVRFVGGCDGFTYSALINLPGALVDYHGDATMFAYCASTPFTNFGTVRKSAGTGTSGLGIAFYNSGTLDVQTGTLDLDQGGEGGGLFEAEAGTTLQMGGGTYTVDPGGVLAGAGTNLWNGSFLFLNGNATGSNLILAGGYLLGGGVISGSLNWTGGQIGYNGYLTALAVATNGLLVVNFPGGAQNDCWGALTNAGTMRLLDGTVRFVGGCDGFNFSALINLPGALVDYHGDATMFAYCASTPFTNFGTVRKSAGTGTSGLGMAFYNSGMVDAQTGTLNLYQGGEGGGMFEAEAGAILQWGGGNFIVDAGGVLAGSGTNIWNGSATVTLNGNATGPNLILANATLLGNGVISGTLTWTGGQIGTEGNVPTLTVATNGLLVLAGFPGTSYYLWGTLTNAGTMLLASGNLELVGSCGDANGTLINLAGALVDFQADTSILPDCGGETFPNFGTVRKSAGTGTSSISAAFYNSGVLDVQSGMVDLSRTYSLTNGSMNFGINSLTNFGQVVLAGSPATLAGGVTANFNNGFVPVLSNQFQTLSYSSVAGTFTSTNLPGGISVVYSTNGAFLAVTSTFVGPLITWTPASLTYGAALSSNQLNATANVAGTFAYTPSNAIVFSAGVHALSVTFTPTDMIDYHSVNATVSLVVSPAPLVVTVNSTNRAYAAINPYFSGTIAGLTNGDIITATYSSVATPLSPPGAYPITPILVDPNNRLGNYVVTTNDGTLTVTNAAFDVVGDFNTNANPTGAWSYGWSTNLGGPFQLLTYSTSPISGLDVGWWNDIALPGSCTVDKDFSGGTLQSGTALFDPDTLHMDPQSYAVTARFTAPSNGNYLVTGLFRLQDTGTHAHDFTILENGNITNFSIFTSGGSPNSQYPFNFTTILSNGETLDFVVSCVNGDYAYLGSGLKVAITNAGPLPTLTITASNASMTYGGIVPVLGFSYSGFTNGDTAASLTTAPSVSTTATSFSHAGSYPITVGGAVDSNYDIVYVQGTLTINPAPLTITASNASKTYGQTAALAATAFSSAGLLNGDTIEGVTLTSTGAAPTAPIGAYALVPSAASGPRAGNYSITYSNGTLTVSTTSLTITADNASKYVGTTLTFVGTEFMAAGLQNGETIGSVTLTSAGALSTATVAGSPYSIMPGAPVGGTFAASNYNIGYSNGLLTVLPIGTPPSISSVLPMAGPNTGGTTVSISGTSFEMGAGVTFGSLPATNVSVLSSSNLTAMTPPSSSGTVGVTVNNPDGNHVTASGAFTFGNAPDITVQPTNLTLSVGQGAQFQVQATGDPTLAYQWQYNGASLFEDSHTSGTKTPTLTVNNVSPGDDGFYRCVVTNLYETVISTGALLTVIVPPSSVTVSPTNVYVGFGGSASFSATASGTAPFGYYWYQNGVLVPGQTGSVFDIASAQNNASYTVVVSNLAGTVTSAPVSLTLLGFCASVQTAQSIYPEGTNFIPLTVQTFVCGTNTPVPNSPVVVWIYTDGTSRMLPTTTDASGNGSVIFPPLPVEVGLVQYAVALPGQPAPAATGSFTIIGMNLSAQSESPVLIPGVPQTNTLLLNNLTDVPLTGISATILGAQADVNVQVSVPSSVPGNGAIQTTYILEATGKIPQYPQFYIVYNSAQGATVTLPFSATISPPTAVLSTTPQTLVGTMIEGSQTLISFTLSNAGTAASGPVQVNVPAVPWLSVATAQPVPSLAANQSGQIMLSLMPTNGQPLGEYPGELVVQGSNSSVTLPFVFTAVSSLKGNLQVTAQDELSIYGAGNPNLSNATVIVSDFLTGTNVGVQVTGSNGIVTFSNLTSAYYTVSVEAPDHGNFSTTLLLAANTTTPVTAFLPLQLVDYTWTVTPTTIEDTYYFTLTTVFVTEVPWPVLLVMPGSIDLCEVGPNIGDSEQVNLIITNAGLIAAEGLQLAIGTNTNWSIVALATNLGNLAAESSIVVPVTFTRIASNTTVSPNIPATVDWYVAAQNQTEYNATPIFIFNANPLNCIPSVGSSTPVAPGGGGGGGGGGGTGTGSGNPGGVGVGSGGNGSSPAQPVVSQPNYTFPPSTNGAVVSVTLQIDQTAVIAANAFHATLNLTNNSDGQVTDLKVTINPVDTNGNPATNAFFVQAPSLSGLNAVDGTGSLAIGAGGQANWTIVPTTNAAPLGSTQYGMGGTLSYMLNGEQVTIPLFPVPITVLPDPQLYLDYFLQHDVYSQDPFASVIEPPIPFALGLRVRNLGLGVANDFTITSAQPVIINNANGLLINFQIISSDVGTNTTPVPSLTLNMGDINPGTNVEGIWWMTCSLEGNFTNFQATFQHSDALGGLETSLVQGVKIHELNHVVEITCPSDDGLPDFLCNDTTNVDALPNDVYSSDGNVYPVTSLTGATSTGSVSGFNSTITVIDVTDIIPSGYVYFELVDPSGGLYAITSVKRSDGVELQVGPDVWQTPYRPNMYPPELHNLIHIFDCNSTGSYTVTYGPPMSAPEATTLAAENVTPTNATLLGVVNPESGTTEYYFQWGLTTNYGNSTGVSFLTANLNSPQAVTAYINNLSPSTTIHYQLVAINSAGTNYGGDQTAGIPALPVPMITQVANQFVIVGQELIITNSAVVATPPVTFTLAAPEPAGASITTNGVFSWAPTCAEGSSTNTITVWATDSGTPPLSNSMTFLVAVSECVQLGVGSAVLQVGQTSGIPVNLFSTVGITNLSFSLAVPAHRFTNYTITSANTNNATATVQAVGSSPPLFTFITQPGQTLPTESMLGTIGFTALPGDSAFVPVSASNIIGIQTGGGEVGNVASMSGQITVIGLHPLLGSALGGNSMITLTLYGNPGSNYQMAFSTNLVSTNWQAGESILLTNVEQNVTIPATNTHMYFRIQ